jgi:hypothetical protein
MMRFSKTALLSSTLLAFIVAISGCGASGAGSVQPPYTGADTNVVKFPRTAVAQFARDSVELSGGIEVYTPFVDSVSQTVAADSLATYLGRNYVTLYKNTYNDATPADTEAFYQSGNDDLYQIDAGLEAINKIAAVPVALGTQVHVGWVLEAKLGSAKGTQWIAMDTTLSVPGPFVTSMTLVDTATMMADTSYSLAGKVYSVKHAQHRITGTASVGSAYVNYDVYISPVLGCRVIYRIHEITYSFGGANGSQNGMQTILTAHN